MSDEEQLKLTRRLFLRHAAVATAATGGLSGIVLRTDAQAQPPIQPESTRGGFGHQQYPYTDP